MQLNQDNTILLVSPNETARGQFHQRLNLWGYATKESSAEAFVDVDTGIALVLLDVSSYEAAGYKQVYGALLRQAENAEVPVVYFVDNPNHIPPNFREPVVCLHNPILTKDYLRLRILESSKISGVDNYIKSLLVKDKEKETVKKSFQLLKEKIQSFPEAQHSKILFLDAWGNPISYSQEAQNVFVQNEKLLRHHLLKDLSKSDFNDLLHSFRSFHLGQASSATHWVRIRISPTHTEHYKVILSSFLKDSDFGFVSVVLEGVQIDKELRGVVRQKMWFNEVIEAFSGGTGCGNTLSLNANIEKLLYLLPKLVDLKRVVVLLKNASGDQFRLAQEWIRSGTVLSAYAEDRLLSFPKTKALLEVLDGLRLQEIDLAGDNQPLTHVPVFAEFAAHLNLSSFIHVPISNASRVMGYVLLDLNSENKPSAYRADQLSGQLIAQALHFNNKGDNQAESTHAYDFLNFLPVPIFIKNRQHKWVLVNDAMLNFMERKRDEVIGKNDYELFGEQQAHIFWETDELVLSEKISFQNEEYFHIKPGKSRIVVTNKSLFQTAENEVVIVSTLKDVTNLKQVEKDLRERSEKLRKSERNLKTLNSTKDRFFSIIAHDLKNPFNTLVGFSSILAEDLEQFDKSEIQEFIKIIYDAAQHGYKLLENLLDWARTQTGKFNFEPTTISIQYLVDECLALLNASAEKKNVKLVSYVDHSIYAFADSNMVEMVIRNLLSNAVKFTHFGGEVSIHAKEQGDYIQISVTDNGIGIKEEDIDKLFRIDVEFTSVGTDSETGTGFGLILCKEFVEKNKGKIFVESEFGKGSTFYVTLLKDRDNYE